MDCKKKMVKEEPEERKKTTTAMVEGGKIFKKVAIVSLKGKK